MENDMYKSSWCWKRTYFPRRVQKVMGMRNKEFILCCLSFDFRRLSWLILLYRVLSCIYCEEEWKRWWSMCCFHWKFERTTQLGSLSPREGGEAITLVVADSELWFSTAVGKVLSQSFRLWIKYCICGFLVYGFTHSGALSSCFVRYCYHAITQIFGGPPHDF